MLRLFQRFHGSMKMIYPEHGYIPLDRWGKQRVRTIPPNLVLALGDKALSFFIEAPRPIGWGDTKDLKKAWSLYTSLRPDLLVYGGIVLDIVRLGEEPPILKPDLIVEFKELSDWYKRAREVRGPLAKPLSAEEWRSRWIEGLWTGLADILGVKRSEVVEKVTPRGVRLKEVQLVSLYKKIYEPREVIVISRMKTPREVKKDLRRAGVRVIDGIGFKPERLKDVVDILLSAAKPAGSISVTLDTETLELLQEYAKLRGLTSYEMAIREALREVLKSM